MKLLYFSWLATGFALGYLWACIVALTLGRVRNAENILRPSTRDGAA